MAEEKTTQVAVDGTETEVLAPAPLAPVVVPDQTTRADPPPAKPASPSDDEGAAFPAGQIALGVGSVLTLGSVALASVVGPWGLLAAPGAVVAGGGAYVAWRLRGRRRRGWAGGSRPRGGAGGRSAGARPAGGLFPAGGRSGGRAAGRSGGRPAGAARSAGVRPAPTSRSAPWARGSAAGARPGGGGRPAGGGAPRLGARPAGGRPTGGRPSSSGDPSTRRGQRGNPSRRGGMGPAPKNRWGAARPADQPTGRLGRAVRAAGRRAADWADDRTGRRASRAWRAARNQPGFRAAHRAARAKLRGRRGLLSEVVALLAAVASWLRSLWATRRDGDQAAETHNQQKQADGGEQATPQASPGGAAAGTPGAVPPTTSGQPTAEPSPPGPTASRQSPWEPWRSYIPPPFTPTATTATTTGGARMSTFPLAEIAADMQGAAARYAPQDVWQVIADAEQLPHMIENVAKSLRIYTERLVTERFPLDQSVIDQLGEAYRALTAAVPLAEDVAPMIRKVHNHDVDRREAPRGDESLWNV